MSRKLKILIAAGAVVAVATPSLATPPDHRVAQDARDSAFVFRNDGKFVGRDPDVNVRFELMRDAYANEN
jgi:hypothetical protein